MNSIEIRGEDIDVEEIMRRIRENIKKRREEGAYTKEMDDLVNGPLSAGELTEVQSEIDFINSSWDIHAGYSITSHRPILGRFLVWGRRLVHGEVRRYVDIIARKQTEFNTHLVRAITGLNQALQNIKETQDRQARFEEETSLEVRETQDRQARFEEETSLEVRETQDRQARFEERITNRNLGIKYFVFEDRFRGSSEDIKQRQSIFFEYFRGCRNVLDIGCGRGEFLELLKENGVGAYGVDIDRDMTNFCQGKGLDVREGDGLLHLESVEGKSLDGIFLGQVVEHLYPKELVELVKLSYDKLKYGTYFVAETINPLCLSIITSSLYMDLSHIKPVHPETIKFLLESVGFRDVQFRFFSPIPEESRLQKFDLNKKMTQKEKQKYEVMNQNIDKLNDLLYGHQDYAVIGKK